MHLEVSMTNFQRNYIDLAKLRLDWASAGIDRLEELVDSFLVTEPCEVVTSMKLKGEYAPSFVRFIIINNRHHRSDSPPETLSTILERP